MKGTITMRNGKKLKAVLGTLGVAAVVTAVLVVAGCKKKDSANLNLTYISPSAVAATADGGVVVTDAGQNKVYCLSADGNVTATFDAGLTASGVCVSPNGTVYVTAGEAAGKVFVLDGSLNKKAEIAVGHTPLDPTLSPDGGKLYVANRFTGTVSVIDTATNTVTGTACSLREPTALAVTSDGTLYAASLLPDQAMTDETVACTVKKVTADGTVSDITLTNGTTAIRDLCVSPDGKYLLASHVVGRYAYPTTQLDRGWINTNALSLIDLAKGELYHTVLLDAVDEGAANPWGVTFTPDGGYVVVSLAGTNQLEYVHYPSLLTLLSGVREGGTQPVDDLNFLNGVRYRVDLPGVGPRAICTGTDSLFVAQYFTGNVVKLDASTGALTEFSLGKQSETNILRQGEMVWNDGTLCYQGWQTCASCHPDGRVDALNWDNLNDGIGNSKQTKSLLYCYFTPPEMITGIRASAEIATRAGMKYIEFSTVPEETLEALDEYIKYMRPVQSPYLNVDGSLTESAKRGKALFESEEVGCAACHSGTFYTNLHSYDVGTVDPTTDGASQTVSVLDTPTLAEVWRTAPYLYNGKAKTIYDVIKTFNPNDTHGHTSQLSEEQLRDLEQYVLSIGTSDEPFLVSAVTSVDKDGTGTPYKIVPGNTFTSVEVRNVTKETKSATVTFELFDKNGASIGKKSQKVTAEPNYTASVKLDIAVPADLEPGAYYTVSVAGTDLKVTY